MNRVKKLKILLSAASLFLGLYATDALAKDVFYYIGYENIQVIDGDSDTIVADIPVDGWLRETDFSADKKYLYATSRRHLIDKIDLAAKHHRPRSA